MSIAVYKKKRKRKKRNGFVFPNMSPEIYFDHFSYSVVSYGLSPGMIKKEMPIGICY